LYAPSPLFTSEKVRSVGSDVRSDLWNRRADEKGPGDLVAIDRPVSGVSRFVFRLSDVVLEVVGQVLLAGHFEHALPIAAAFDDPLRLALALDAQRSVR